MDLYLSSPLPTPPGSPQPCSYDKPLDAQWYDLIPPPIDEVFNMGPHILALAPWFRENVLCIMVIPNRINVLKIMGGVCLEARWLLHASRRANLLRIKRLTPLSIRAYALFDKHRGL